MAGTGRSRSKRTRTQRERDRVQIADWYCHGMTQAQICRKLQEDFYPGESPLTQQQISIELKTIIKGWQESYKFSIDQQRVIEIEKINNLEQTYYDAWIKSMGEHTTTVTERNEGMSSGRDDDKRTAVGRVKAKLAKVTRDGNPAFLAGIQWCIEARCKLMGLNAPVQLENQGAFTLNVVYDDKQKVGATE
jgi:hypothetical protein